MKLNVRLLGLLLATTGLIFYGAYSDQPVKAATITGWDAGNIMSDSVMSSETSMTKSQIQSFLNSQNKCNKSVASADGKVIGESSTVAYWKSNKSIKYQITGGKKGTTKGAFRCLAKATFSGESAADIIYSASRTYDINPQVLIVLLQKESGLITDLWPNSNQYRTAMGYGCPDNGPNNTANCSSNYYGFKNQIRLAADMLREVLDGGWTNYPVGNNYVQYNPNANCGGKTINIKNRATSALYRYTPYQPNSATLKRSWPITAPYPSCGAYGNLNFYMMFRQWFGSTRADIAFEPMNEARYMRLKNDVRKTNLSTGQPDGELLSEGMEIYFSTRYTYEGELYVRTKIDTQKKRARGIRYSDLESITPRFESMSTPRWMEIKTSSPKIDPITTKPLSEPISSGNHLFFVDKTTVGGETFLRTTYNAEHDHQRVIPYNKVKSIPVKYERLSKSRWMTLNSNLRKSHPTTDIYSGATIPAGTKLYFSTKIKVNGELMLRTSADTKKGIDLIIPYSSTSPEIKFESINKGRYLKLKKNVRKTNLIDGESDGAILRKGTKIYFSSKYIYKGELYLRTKVDHGQRLDRGILFSDLTEVK